MRMTGLCGGRGERWVSVVASPAVECKIQTYTPFHCRCSRGGACCVLHHSWLCFERKGEAMVGTPVCEHWYEGVA